MTASHHKGHVCRAALEAAAYQAREVFEAIYKDSNVQLKNLKVDGGGTNNKLLMQFQADIIDVPVVKPHIMETTAMGAAFAAGLAVGFWRDMDEIKELWSVAATFTPSMKEAQRANNWNGWQKAISKSLDWVEEEDFDEDDFYDAREVNKSLDMPFLANGDANPAGLRNAISSIVLVALGVGAGFLLGRNSRQK
jgi:glycerol kinase